MWHSHSNPMTDRGTHREQGCTVICPAGFHVLNNCTLRAGRCLPASQHPGEAGSTWFIHLKSIPSLLRKNTFHFNYWSKILRRKSFILIPWKLTKKKKKYHQGKPTTTTLGLSLPVLAHMKSSGTLDSPANQLASWEEAWQKYYADDSQLPLAWLTFSLTMTYFHLKIDCTLIPKNILWQLAVSCK